MLAAGCGGPDKLVVIGAEAFVEATDDTEDGVAKDASEAAADPTKATADGVVSKN